MSFAKPPEFFFDRSLGKASAAHLRNHGWIVHLIADHYDGDAEDVADEEWIAEGCSRGWLLLTKDKKIRIERRS
jgi:PIN like domain